MGFRENWLFIPNQIGPLNEIFMPTEKKLAWARKVVTVFDEAEAKGQAVLQVDGKMIRYPIANRARRIIQLAELCAKRKTALNLE